MYCPNCGKEIQKGTIFCPHCGKQLIDHSQVSDESAASPDREEVSSGTDTVSQRAVLNEDAGRMPTDDMEESSDKADKYKKNETTENNVSVSSENSPLQDTQTPSSLGPSEHGSEHKGKKESRKKIEFIVIPVIVALIVVIIILTVYLIGKRKTDTSSNNTESSTIISTSSNEKNDTGKEAEEESEDNDDTQQEADLPASVPFHRGTFENGVYTNESANIRINLGEEVTTATDSELAKISGIDEEDFTDAFITDYVSDGYWYFDLEGYNTDPSYPFFYMEISFKDNYSFVGPVKIEEQTLCNTLIEKNVNSGLFKKSLESLGLNNVETETSEVTVCGRTLPAAALTGSISGTELQGYRVYWVEGQFMVNVLVISTSSEEVDSILDGFEEIEPNESSEAATDSSQQGTTESASTESTSAS